MTANILHEDQRHVYMIAIYMQLYLMAMVGAFKPKTTDFEVCTFSMEPYNFFNKDIEVRLHSTEIRVKQHTYNLAQFLFMQNMTTIFHRTFYSFFIIVLTIDVFW